MERLFPYFVIFLFLSTIHPLKGQDAVQSQQTMHKQRTVIHKWGVDFSPGYIFQTHSFFRGYNSKNEAMTKTFSAHLKYAFQFSRHTRMGKMYPYASQGIGISYNDFSNSHETGNPIAVYVFQNSRIAKLGKCVSLDYEWNFGVSFNWHRYNAETNPMNGVVGSPMNAYINLGLLLNWQLASHWNLTTGIGLSHFSNGNTRYPNAGVNTANARVGFVHTINSTEDDSGKGLSSLSQEKLRHRICYDLVVYGAWRKRGFVEPDSYNRFMIPGKFSIVGLNFNPMYNFNKYFRLGTSLDIQYDRSANLTDYYAGNMADDEHIPFYRPPLKMQIGFGLSARAELVMPVFTINLGFGKNFIGRGKDLNKSYQIFALKTNLNRHLFIHVGYQLYRFKDPNNLMLGMGFRFNAP